MEELLLGGTHPFPFMQSRLITSCCQSNHHPQIPLLQRPPTFPLTPILSLGEGKYNLFLQDMLIMSQYILELWCSRDFQKSHCSIPVGTLVLSSPTLSGTYCTHDSTIIRLLFLNHIIFFSLARNDSSFTLVSGQIRIYISTERRKPYAF